MKKSNECICSGDVIILDLTAVFRQVLPCTLAIVTKNLPYLR